MSLKLIRDAALVATLSEAEIKALSTIKVATGASSLVDIVSESFMPSDDDFDAWMRVVVGEAGDRGINLNKKSEFMQLAMDVLENDPANPPFDMQEMIAGKLWQDYNSAKNAVRINKLAQAKEEEEKVETARKQIASRYAQGPGATAQLMKTSVANDEEEMGISDDLAARKIFNKIKGTPNLNFAVVQQYVNKYIGMVGKSPTDVKYISALVYSMVQDAGMAEENEESGFEQALKAAVGMEEEEPSFVRDALRDSSPTSMKGSFSSHLRGEDGFDDTEDADTEVSFGPDGVEGISDEDVFTSDDECECPCADDETSTEEIPSDEFADDEMGPPSDELDDETMDDIDADVEPRAPKKGFDEEEAVKSFFRQAVTSPNDMMRQAVKDIEAEGKSAWTKANVPANPHPKKSQAHRAWQKGLTNAAKEALGIADKPADPKAKPKRKK